MKYFITLSAVAAFLSLGAVGARAQGIMEKSVANIPGVANRKAPTVNDIPEGHMPGRQVRAVTPQAHNYTSFSAIKVNKSKEIVEANKGYEHHPELGMLFREKPCDNCYELLGNRSEISKYFVKEGTNGRDIVAQTSSEPMHYRDGQGNWRTIKTKLEVDNARKGVYAAYEQTCPVMINTNASGNSAIGKTGESIAFNNGLELVYEKADGSQVSLGIANWTSLTAGDDGVYVKEAWPGIDIELYAFRGGIETNFIITHPLPAYADGKLLVRDHFQMPKDLRFSFGDNLRRGVNSSANTAIKHTGVIAIKNAAGKEVYDISDASIYEQNNANATYQQLEYYVNGNQLDIAVPGNFLNRGASSYPVVIDPLVTQNTTLAIPPDGSTYNPALASQGGCLYINPATTPANVTVSDITWADEYTARAGAVRTNGYTEFYLGACRNPGPVAGPLTTLWWYCNLPTAGACQSNGAQPTYSIFSDLQSCLPPQSCTPIPLNIKMYLHNTYQTTAPCANTYIYLTQPLIISVFGRTVQVGGAGAVATASPATICAGASSTIAVTPIYGVPTYTVTWSPIGATGNSVVVSPTVTTTYTCTLTDACNNTATSQVTVTVNPLATLTGVTTVCVGNTTTLSHGTVAGTWSSTNNAIATVVAATGVVSGVSQGTDVIRFTSSTGGCISTITVTVTPLPGAIAGVTSLCAGSSITLSDAAPGGTWLSSNTSVATIDPNGVVYGLTPGTSTITYTFGGACSVTLNITVNLLAPITGNLTICAGGTTTLSDAAQPGTWTSSNQTVATIDVNTGQAFGTNTAGTATISFNNPNGCSATAVLTVNGFFPITGITHVCIGNTITLHNVGIGGTWTSDNLPVATVASSSGIVTGVAQGVAGITYTMPGNCAVSTNVTVDPLPAAIGGTLNVCVGSSTQLNDATGGGTWSVTGNGGAATITNTGGVLAGVTAGNVNVTYTTPQGCIATTPVVVNPLPAQIGGITSICAGTGTQLNDASPNGTWSTANTNIATVDATGFVTTIVAGTANITYTLPTGCSITIPVVANPIPAPPVVTDVDYCQHDQQTLPLTATGTGLLWYTTSTGGHDLGGAPIPSAANAGTTTWYVSQTAQGCTSMRAAISAIIHPRPARPFIAPHKPFVCQYDTVDLAYTGPAYPNLIFGWTIPDYAVFTDGTTDTFRSVEVMFDTTYRTNNVTLTVGDGYVACNITDTFNMPVYNASPAASVSMQPFACVGDSVTVSLLYNGPGVTDYHWDFDNGNVVVASADHGGPYKVVWYTPGNHEVDLSVISNKFCPSRTFRDTIDIHPLPDAGIAATKEIVKGDKTQISLRNTTLCIGDSLEFTAHSYDPEDKYTWTPSHWFKQNNKNIIVGTVDNPGYVTLTVTNAFGCTNADSIQVSAQSCCNVIFPNSFTPNGDNHNDVFRPIAIGNHKIHAFRIANRWGQTVYDSDEERAAWDGNFNGVPQDMGVYFFFIKYDCAGKTIEEKGEVNLIR